VPFYFFTVFWETVRLDGGKPSSFLLPWQLVLIFVDVVVAFAC
jgi:hypothetical protein